MRKGLGQLECTRRLGILLFLLALFLLAWLAFATSEIGMEKHLNVLTDTIRPKLSSPSNTIWSASSNVDLSSNAPTNSRFDHLPKHDHDPSELRAWFTARARNNTIMMSQTNKAGTPFTKNMICSLVKSDPTVIQHIIIWATDEEAAKDLLLFEAETTRLTGYSFGVYFDRRYQTNQVWNGGWDNSTGYFEIMDIRRLVFARVIEILDMSLIFVDGDVVFFKNPFTTLNVPFGVPGLAHGLEEDEITVWEDLYNDLPDLVYSTDARKQFDDLDDPYEGEPRVPKLCGGFFYARVNGRTKLVFKSLLAMKMNDQWGMVDLLNNYFDSVLVNPLPLGIKSRKDRPQNARATNIARDAVRVLILSQVAYMNALSHQTSPSELPEHFHSRMMDLEERGESRVLYHPNWWSRNKTRIFEDHRLWTLALDHQTCAIEPEIPDYCNDIGVKDVVTDIKPLETPTVSATEAWRHVEQVQDGPSPNSIPRELKEAFLNSPALEFQQKFMNETRKNTFWSPSYINNYRSFVNSRKPFFSQNVTDLYLALESWASTAVQNKRCLVIGSDEPWQEAMLLEFGASHVSTVEMASIDSRHPLTRMYTPTQFEKAHQRGSLQPFDCCLVTSWLQHTGLGRYGEGLEPAGDLYAMRRIMSVLKPGGIAFVGIPTGDDALIWNEGRIYGRGRLPLLFAGWAIKSVYPEKVFHGDKPSYSIWVLKNTAACT
ncbi:hypothetical protein SmJEL517_g04262 [Synchytrium microbalum]|uniref:Nucleotide-diphospho-sugar transferase domain-containing protein n=1 Tax=Synchytrium microbalum TaxID=1806994 RepID=A0A507C5I0_9FUNG|nr:uncharacterized protein SmJEL517_g04262 [Synchytrium microbalum]TPX32705.1 hypothetical protein SmJEL517_g04262 [Synchytrium microbalum]